jgi:hypothetical protein
VKHYVKQTTATQMEISMGCTATCFAIPIDIGNATGEERSVWLKLCLRTKWDKSNVPGFTLLIYDNICNQYIILDCTHSVGKCHKSRFLKLSYSWAFEKKNWYALKLHPRYTRERAVSQEISLRRFTTDVWVGPQNNSYEICSERRDTKH